MGGLASAQSEESTDGGGEGGDKDAISGAMEGAQDAVKSLFEDPVGTLQQWIVEDGPRVLGKIALFLVILGVARLLSRFFGRITRGALTRSKVNASELFKNFVENTVSKIVFFIGLVIALQNIGLDVAPILAGMGVVGFVVGFALQDTLGNFAAGIMLLMYRPYDVGDYVNLAGEEGTVKAMTLVSTTMLTLDNHSLTIPNGKIWGTVIRNVTAQETRRVEQTIGIGYGDDIAAAEEALLEVARSIEDVQEEPAPAVFVTQLGDSSVGLSTRFWVPTSRYFGAACTFRKQAKMRLDRDGISIPFPQRDVHLHQAAAD